MRWGKIIIIVLHFAGALQLTVRLMGDQVMAAPTQTDFRDMRLGLFVHYTYVGRPYEWGSTTWSDASPVASLDELANNLDVDDLARIAALLGIGEIELSQDTEGLKLRLGDGQAWDLVDTVIVLK
jgi:hypothetical protein